MLEILTINIRVLGSFREDLPQGFVFGCIPFHLNVSFNLKRVDFLTDGGSTKSPRGKGSLMKTVYDGSELDIVDVW